MAVAHAVLSIERWVTPLEFNNYLMYIKKERSKELTSCEIEYWATIVAENEDALQFI